VGVGSRRAGDPFTVLIASGTRHGSTETRHGSTEARSSGAGKRQTRNRDMK